MYRPVEEGSGEESAVSAARMAILSKKTPHLLKSQDLKLLQNYASFDYTIFDQYEGFIDEQCMTVGPPPYWVKPAFPGADHNRLPIPKVYLETPAIAI